MTLRERGSHLTEGCEGEWIDISSLSEQAWTCSHCRAVVADPEPQKPRGELTPAEDQPGEQRAPPLDLWPILVGLLVGGIILALTFSLWRIK